MAYTTINKSSDYFNTKLYTGTGSQLAVSSVGFQPDLVWTKNRVVNYSNWLFDVVRGVNKGLRTDNTGGESDNATRQVSFDSDGFTLGANADVNVNTNTYASWNWKAGTSVSGNTTGSGTAKTYTGSVNTTSGFSIIKYTGNGTAGHTIPHNLGVAPTFRITKRLNSVSDWPIYNEVLGNTKEIKFTTTASGTTTNYWNSTSPNATNFTLGTNGISNENGSEFISYNFTPIQGYSKFGSYIGNGNADGTFVYTGFKPAFVIVKATSTTSDWNIMDNKRAVSFNPNTKELYANSNSVEATGGQTIRDYLSNGFKLRGTSGGTNGSGVSYIYMAFGQSIVGSNNVPNNAR